MKRHVMILGAVLCIVSCTTSFVNAAANIWSGSAGDKAWATPGNWSVGVPTTTSDVIFGTNDTTGGAGPATVSNNVVSGSTTILSLQYTNGSGYHHTRIPEGVVLTVANSGTASNALLVNAAATNAGRLIYATISGPGTLNVENSSNAIMLVSQRMNVNSAGGSHLATLDMSGLDNFLANIRELNLAANGGSLPNNSPNGRLYLARTNTITCSGANGVIMGYGSVNCGTNMMMLGQRNYFNSDSTIVAGYKCGGSAMKFNPIWTDSLMVIRDRLGVGPAAKWSVAENGAGNTGSGCVGTADFTAGTLDASINVLYVARSYNLASQTGTGTSTGTLNYNTGIVGANNVEIGYQSQVSNGRAIGVVNMGANAAMWVTNDLRLGRFAGSQDATGGSANGTLNVLGGNVHLYGNLIDGGGTSTVLVTNNGYIDLMPAGDSAAGNLFVDNLTIASGSTVSNAFDVAVSNLVINGTMLNINSVNASNVTGSGAVTVANGFVLAENGKMAIGVNGKPGTFTVGGAVTLNNNGYIQFDLADTTTEGGGTNDLIVINGDLILNGVTKINVNFYTNAPITPAIYTIIRYTGVLGGSAANFAVVGPRYDFAIDDAIPGEIRIVVSGSGTPADLDWYCAGASPVWDVNGQMAWYNPGKSDIDYFYRFDNVQFGNNGDAWPLVTISGLVEPTAITVNPDLVNYTFAGSGSIGGPATLTKNGATTLTISNANSYNGLTTINGGVVTVGAGTAFGSTNAGTLIANGAMVDLNGQNLGYEPVTAQGVGTNNLGVIYNSQPGTGTAPGLKQLTLSGNTTFGGVGRWDIRDNVGGLLGNGFNLTKVATNTISIKDVGETSLGDIIINEGILYFEGKTSLGLPDKTLTVNPLGTLGFYSNNTNLMTKQLTMNGGAISNGAGNNVFTGPVTLADNISVNCASNSSVNLMGSVTGNKSITKNAGGTLILSGTNEYAGTLHNNGTLALSNNMALGTTHNVIMTTITGGSGLTGTRLTLLGGVTTPSGVTVSMPSDTNGALRSSFVSDGPASNIWNGSVTLNGNNIINFAANSNAPLTLNGEVAGNNFTGVMFVRGSGAVGTAVHYINGRVNIGTASFSITDNAMCTVNGVNNVWGITGLAYGKLRIGGNNFIPTTASITFGQTGASDGGVLDLAGFNQTVGTIFMAGAAYRQFVGNSSTNSDSVFTYNSATNSTFSGAIVDSVLGGTRKTSLVVAGGTLNLAGTNGFTGTTLINENCTLMLAPTGSLAYTALIDVKSGARFDVSTVSGYTLFSNQTLMGNGVVTGSVTVAQGATIAPGASIGTLPVLGMLMLQGTAAMEIGKNGSTLASDLLTATDSLTLGGTLTVVHLGPDALAVNDTFKLFDAPLLSGMFTTFNLPVLSGGLAWDTSKLNQDGTIKVVGSTSQPTFSSISVTGSNVVFSGTGGTPNSAYRTLFSTNVALPMLEWIPIATNYFDANGNFNSTNAVSPSEPRQYFRIAIP